MNAVLPAPRRRPAAGAARRASPRPEPPPRMNEVLDVAARLFNAHGFRQTSLAEVGAALGMNKASLYYYVRSKDELLQHLIYRAAQPLRQLAGDPALVELAPGAALERLVREHCRVILAHPDEYGTLIRQRPHIDARALAPIATRERAYSAALRAAIERVGASTQAARRLDSGVATQLAMDSINSILRWYDPRGDIGETGLIDQVWLFVSRALGVGARRPA